MPPGVHFSVFVESHAMPRSSSNLPKEVRSVDSNAYPLFKVELKLEDWRFLYPVPGYNKALSTSAVVAIVATFELILLSSGAEVWPHSSETQQKIRHYCNMN